MYHISVERISGRDGWRRNKFCVFPEAFYSDIEYKMKLYVALYSLNQHEGVR